MGPDASAARSPQLRNDIHEAFDALAVDRIPGFPVDLEMRADHHAVGYAQDFADIVDVDAGVGEYRHGLDRVANAAQVRAIDRFAGNRSGDQDRVGERGEDGAPGAQFDRTLIERMGELSVDVEQELHVVASEMAA